MKVWVHKAPLGWFVYNSIDAARAGEDTARDLRRLPFSLLDVDFVVDEALRRANPRPTHAWAVGTLSTRTDGICGPELRYHPLAGTFTADGVQVQHTGALLFTVVGSLSLCCICQFPSP